jgi:hypothetical protein
MNTREQVVQVLNLSGLEPTRAGDVADLIDSLYNVMPRPEASAVAERLDQIAENSARILGDNLNDQEKASLSKRISELSYEIFIGLITNAAWDAIKFAWETAKQYTNSAQNEKIHKSTSNSLVKYQEIKSRIPRAMSQSEVSRILIEMDDVLAIQKEYIRNLLAEDPEIVAIFRNKGLEPRGFNHFAANNFYYIFDLPASELAGHQ